ncbi:MAG: glycosyltransferase [Candidatus Hydrogenedentes bacterium]|nr:glycosyltransferase [Candidatus Hydrogenedentota bacterium]
MSTLSIAMIVKDEALLLPECLQLARQWADEICVVDTGSTDGTLEILAAHGCRTGTMAWNDDFSAARNAAIELCAGDWVFALDADERLRAEDHAALRGLCDAAPDHGVRFITRNYTDRSNLADFVAEAGAPEALGFPGWFPSGKVRLFPRRADLRFEGVVHEMINPSLERVGLPILDSPIPVLHYPLLKPEAAHASKRDLYLRLGEAKCAAEPDNPKAFSELGDQLMDMEDAGGAMKAYREAVRLDPENPRRLVNLGTALYLLGHKAQAAAFLDAALQRDASLADGWRNLGVLRAEEGDWAGALRCFESALCHAQSNADLQRYAALAHHQLGQHVEAWQYICRVLLACPEHGEVQALWRSIAKAEGMAPFVARFRQFHEAAFPPGLLDKLIQS